MLLRAVLCPLLDAAACTAIYVSAQTMIEAFVAKKRRLEHPDTLQHTATQPRPSAGPTAQNESAELYKERHQVHYTLEWGN